MLSRHAFGHHVIEAILQCAAPEHTHEIAAAVLTDVSRFATNRNSTYVVERALHCCSEDDQHALVSEMAGTDASLLALVDNQFGCHVARALVKMPGALGRQVVAVVDSAALALQKSKYGRRVLEDRSRLALD